MRIFQRLFFLCLLLGAIAADASGSKNELDRGIELLSAKQYNQAQIALQTATKKMPSSAEAFFYLGMAEYHLGNLQAAETSLRRSLQLNSSSENTAYNLGMVLLDGGKPKEAANYFWRIYRESSKKSPEITASLVRAQLAAGESLAAKRLASESVQKATEPALPIAIGQIFLARRMSSDARAAFEKAHQLAPHQPSIVMLLSEACLQEKNAACSREALAAMPHGSNSIAQFHFLKARTHFLADEEQAGFSELKTAIELDPSTPMYRLILARYYQKYGNQDQAIVVLRELDELAPTVAEVPYSQAISYAVLNQFDTALQLLDRAQILNPEFDRARLLKGIIMLAEGNLAEAEKDLSVVAKRLPKNSICQTFYGMTLLKQKKNTEAVLVLRNAVQINPSYAFAHFQLGQALATVTQDRNALRELEKAVDLQPGMVEAYFHLGRLYHRLGQPEKSEKAMAIYKNYLKEGYKEERIQLLRELEGDML